MLLVLAILAWLLWHVTPAACFFCRPRGTIKENGKKNCAGSKTLPASIKEKETHWPEYPLVSSTKPVDHLCIEMRQPAPCTTGARHRPELNEPKI